MKIKVLVFASFREIAGGDSIEVEMEGSGPWSIAELRKKIAEQFSALSGRMGSTMFAVNETIARDIYIFKAGDRVAALPPVSGG